MGNGTVHSGKGMEKHVPILVNRRTVDKWIGRLVVGALAGGTLIKYGYDRLSEHQKPAHSTDTSRTPQYLTDPAECVYELGNGLYDLDPGHRYTAKLGGVYSKAPYNGIEHVMDTGVPAVNIAVGYDGKNPFLFLFATKAYMDRYSELAPTPEPGNIRYRNDVDILQIDTNAAKEMKEFPGMFVQTKPANLKDLKDVVALLSPDDYYRVILNIEGIKNNVTPA